MARIAVVTSGHLSTCPRMLKAADALHAAGHDVRVISTVHTAWAAEADRVYADRRWTWQPIDYRRSADTWRWLATGVRSRAAMTLARMTARGLNGWTSGTVAARALGRAHDELVTTVLSQPIDLVYGGTRGAIAAVIEAARVAGVPCGVDFEDFHCGEDEPGGEGTVRNDLSAVVMRDAVGKAAFVTAGSAAIAEACAARFGGQPIAINNVFRLPEPPSLDRSAGPLRLYWFSQTIGHGRGLEDVVDAVGRAGIACSLHLRGAGRGPYVDELRARASRVAPRLELTTHDPASPERMIDSCHGFDAGISAEQGHIPNRQLNLPNKALTYPLAGLGLVLTATAGHRPLADDLEGTAVSYAPGDVGALADGLGRWDSPAELRRARDAAWTAARTRWHWDHPFEREALLGAIEAAL
jgi:hypothetical protein